MTHAESSYEDKGRLTENGKTQAFELAHSRVASGVFSICSSPADAAIATGKELEIEFEVSLESIEDLVNVKLGKREPSTEDMTKILPSLWRDPEWVPDNGESLMIARERISSYMSRLVGRHKNVGIAIVTHPMIAVLIDTLVMGGAPEVDTWLSMGYASCAAYEYSRDGWVRVSSHDNSYLTQPSTVRDMLPKEILDALDSP